MSQTNEPIVHPEVRARYIEIVRQVYADAPEMTQRQAALDVIVLAWIMRNLIMQGSLNLEESKRWVTETLDEAAPAPVLH